MGTASHRFGWYLAILQLFFTLCWTVYALYLPQLAASAGIAAGAIIFILMLDQAIFTVCDFLTGIATDKVTRVLGRVGPLVAAVTVVSCIAFFAMPLVAPAGALAFIAVTTLWTITSSALRAPPLMLLGKYAAKPSLPYLSSLAMLGLGLAGAVGPYLAVTMRTLDPRIPFTLASLVLVLVTFGIIAAERGLKQDPARPAASAQERPFGTFSRQAIIFALAITVLAIGYQVHFALESRPLYLRFAQKSDLQWLMPVFWIGFNVTMFPASVITKKYGGYTVMGAAGLIGALAILGAHAAQDLQMLVVAQLAAGGAWGAILMSAFTVAFTVGANGGEGRMSGLLFSALALATFARMAAVATGINADPALHAVLQWVPTVCWAVAGAALLYLAVAGVRRWAAQ
jgi:hypothetical protein